LAGGYTLGFIALAGKNEKSICGFLVVIIGGKNSSSSGLSLYGLHAWEIMHSRI